MERYSVVEKEIAAPNAEKVIAENKSKDDAEAIVRMAVVRRGVEKSFFFTRKH